MALFGPDTAAMVYEFPTCLDIVTESVATTGEGAKWGAMVVFEGLRGPVGWSWGIYMVEGRGWWRWRWIPLDMEVALWPVTAAAPAQHESSSQAEAGRCVAQIHSQADLIFHPTGEEGVVKIHDDIVGGPGHGDQAEQPST